MPTIGIRFAIMCIQPCGSQAPCNPLKNRARAGSPAGGPEGALPNGTMATRRVPWRAREGAGMLPVCAGKTNGRPAARFGALSPIPAPTFQSIGGRALQALPECRETRLEVIEQDGTRFVSLYQLFRDQVEALPIGARNE